MCFTFHSLIYYLLLGDNIFFHREQLLYLIESKEMKKFSVPCDFNGVKSPFTIYVGAPKEDHHPIHFQSDWLSKERGGTVPQEVMVSLAQLKDIATKNGVSFEDLCVYALGAAQQDEEAGEDPGTDDQSSDATTSGDTGTDGQLLNDNSNDQFDASTNDTSTDSQWDDSSTSDTGTDSQLDENSATNDTDTNDQVDDGYASDIGTDGQLAEDSGDATTEDQLDDATTDDTSTEDQPDEGTTDDTATDSGTDDQSGSDTNQDNNGVRIATKKIPASDANS